MVWARNDDDGNENDDSDDDAGGDDDDNDDILVGCSRKERKANKENFDSWMWNIFFSTGLNICIQIKP